jgi:cobaltochelatase CobN
MVRIIHSMKDALQFFDTPCVSDLLKHMQAKENRMVVFTLSKGKTLESIITSKKQRITDSTIAFYSVDSVVSMLRIANEKNLFETYIHNATEARLVWAGEVLTRFLDLPQSITGDSRFNNRLAAIIKKNRHVNQLSVSLEQTQRALKKIRDKKRSFAQAVKDILDIELSLQSTVHSLENSGSIELAALSNALNGGYIPPSTGGDAIHNPDAVPTGRNLYGINAENTPGEAAWNAGVALAKEILQFEKNKNGVLPRKIAFTLWGGEFIRDQGTTIAQILYLLGVEPVRLSSGRVQDVRLIPSEKLGRPRIDVVIQTSGQFRDIAASRLFLIDRAVTLAAHADDKEYENYVREGVTAAEKHLKEKGLSPIEARNLSTARVFGGVNGNYGSGIMALVESGDRYDSDTTIAGQYINNMGAVYTNERWGQFTEGLFEAALLNTDVIMHSRSSNTSGPLSLDHVYEFMGGLNTAVKKVTGKDPQGLFIDMRNPGNNQIVDAHEAIWTEARSTILNPNYISPLLKGGKSSAEVFAETVRNTFGWNVTKESIIDDELWDRCYEVLVRDTHNLGTREFFESVNPHAMQEITGVMLETVRKGMWQPDSNVIRELADIHVNLVVKYEAGCSGFVCDNAKLAAMIGSLVEKNKAQTFNNQIANIKDGTRVTTGKAITLKKETVMETLTRIAMNNSILLGALAVIVILLVLPFFTKKKDVYYIL